MTDKPKFTPGPWRVPQCCTLHMDKPSWDEKYSPLVKSGKEVVCGLINVRVADAKLIATAPEMYEMLERLVPVVERFNSAVPLSPYAALDCAAEIRALLAQARGEEKTK